jgi:hypothetical protein
MMSNEEIADLRFPIVNDAVSAEIGNWQLQIGNRQLLPKRAG